MKLKINNFEYELHFVEWNDEHLNMVEKVDQEGNMKVIDLLNKIANGKDIPKKLNTTIPIIIFMTDILI